MQRLSEEGRFDFCSMTDVKSAWELFSPILRVVFLFCLWFHLLFNSFYDKLDPICLFFLILITLGGRTKKDLAAIYVKECLFMFSSKSFIVYGIISRSLIHCEFISVHGVRECFNFTLLHETVQFSQHKLLKRLYFFHCIFLPPLSQNGRIY